MTFPVFNPYDSFNPEMQPKESWLNKNIGGLSSTALAGVNMVSDFVNMGNEAKGLQTKAPQLQTDAFGQPVYNLGNFNSYVKNIKPQGATGGEVISGISKGTAAGAAFGPIGAAGGALVGAIGSLLGGRRRKRIMEEKKQKALRSFRSAQTNYNEAVIGTDTERKALSSYQEQLNNQDRLFNLFNIQPNLGI